MKSRTLKTKMETLQENMFENIEIEKNVMTGEIDSSKSGILFLSIPYEKKFKIYVDDKKVDYYPVLDNAFIAFETFSLNYPKRYFNEIPFFIQQKKNYSSLIYFLQDFQILLDFDSKQWNNILLFKEFLCNRQDIDIDNISTDFLGL